MAKTPREERRERLAAALRANLKRRKAQRRGPSATAENVRDGAAPPPGESGGEREAPSPKD
ncbi:MAG: hypothetical protein ACREHF_15320 [Rhizomicrobium sp.]